MAPVIHARGLTKRYGGRTVVDSLDLTVEAGEIFGFLGPNGAGKTTTLMMLLGLCEPSAGTVRVLDLDPARQPLEVKAQVGYLPENVGFYPDLTGQQNLEFVAALNRLDRAEAGRRIAEALDQVGLAAAAHQKAGQYSRGMRQRLGVAQVLIKRPRLVLLDEPTLGLDHDGIGRMLDLILALAGHQGITVLVSSHLLHQVQRVCTSVGIMKDGHLVAAGRLDQLAAGLATAQGETLGLEEIYMRHFSGS